MSFLNNSFIFKGLLIASFFSISVANAKITDIIKEQTGQEVKVLNEQALKQDSNLKIMTLKDSASGFKILILTNKQESIVLGIGQAIFTSNNVDRDYIINEYLSVGNYNQTFKSKEAVKKAIDTIPKDYIISLKSTNSKSKKLFYIISDPLCPHCQKELDDIDNRLKQGDVYMIPIGWMGEESKKKVSEIYEKIKGAKTDSQKIAILKQIYNPKYSSKSKVNPKVNDIARVLTGEGKVEGTPYILEEDK